MLRIVKGKRTLKVTDKAYENFYKNNGWEIEKRLGTGKASASNSKKPKVEETETEDEWAGIEDEEVRKPLSEMNRQELEQYAAELGVDLTGLSSNKQYREAIKAAL